MKDYSTLFRTYHTSSIIFIQILFSICRWALNVSENLNAIPSSSIPILSSSPSSRRSPSANSYQEDVDGLDGDSKAADSKLVKISNHTPIYVLILD